MKAKKTASKRILPDPGIHVARLIHILDYGDQVDSFAKEGRDKVEFVWELPEEMHVFNEDKGEQPLVVDRKFGNTLGRGSKMKTIIEGMIGKTIDNDFDLESLKYKLCQLTITIENDGEYDNVVIQSASPLGKSQLGKKYPHYNDWLLLDLSYNEDGTSNFDQEVFDALPHWKRKNIAKSQAFAQLVADGIATMPTDDNNQQPAKKPTNGKATAPAAKAVAASPFKKAAGKVKGKK